MAKAEVAKAFRARLEKWPGIVICPLLDSIKEGGTSSASSFLQLHFPFASSERVKFDPLGDYVWREEGAARILVTARQFAGLDPTLLTAVAIARFLRGKCFDGVKTYGSDIALSSMHSSGEEYFVVAIAISYVFVEKESMESAVCLTD